MERTNSFIENIRHFVKERKVILISFLLFHFIIYIFYLGRYSQNSHWIEMVILRSSLLLLYFATIIFALKKYKFAIKIMAIVLVVSGAWNLIFGAIGISLSQYILKAIGIIMGLYFIYGGIMLHKSIKGT